MASFHTESKDKLFQAILELGNLEECYAFFEDLCTIKELDDMALRLETAMLLDKGASYLAISQQAGVSTATISRVNRCLQYGAGGYKNVISRMKNRTEENVPEEENDH